MLYVIVAVCLLGSAVAGAPRDGPCPDIEGPKDFNMANYAGKWYEAERWPASWESDAKCVMADYNLQEDGTIKIVGSQVSEKPGNSSVSEAILCSCDAAHPSKLKITFPTMPGVEAGYWVLGTDYESFSVVYGCSPKSSYAWIFTRAQNPAPEVIAKADKVIADSQISRSNFSKTNQKDCGQS